jgi:prepilin peptidase CpaA
MSIAEVTQWVVATLLTAVLAWASYSDIKDRRIPNWTVLAAAALFAPWAIASSLSWVLWALLAGAIAFAVSFALYASGIVGAGDSKLFAAVALFVGLPHLALLGVGTALVGGAIALISIVSRPRRALVMINMRAKGDFGRGIPYGVAIASAAAALVWAQVLKFPLPVMPGSA